MVLGIVYGTRYSFMVLGIAYGTRYSIWYQV